MKITNEDVKERSKAFCEELGLPITRFAQDVHLSAQSIYKWFNGDIDLCQRTQDRIDMFLRSFNR